MASNLLVDSSRAHETKLIQNITKTTLRVTNMEVESQVACPLP